MFGKLLHLRPGDLPDRHARQRRRGKAQEVDARHVFRYPLRITQQPEFAQGIYQPEQRRLGQAGLFQQFLDAKLLLRHGKALQNAHAARQRADQLRIM